MYSTQYFPGTEYRQLALPITLIAGEVRYAVNFRMPLVQSYSVSGRLTGPEGSYGRQMVRLVSIGTDYGSRTDAAVTLSSADGTFLFPRVPRGEERVARFGLEQGADVVMAGVEGQADAGLGPDGFRSEPRRHAEERDRNASHAGVANAGCVRISVFRLGCAFDIRDLLAAATFVDLEIGSSLPTHRDSHVFRSER